MNDPVPVHLRGLASAVPPFALEQEEALACLLAHYGERLSPWGRRVLGRIFANRSIRKRHFAFTEPARLFTENADQRQARFTEAAVGLAAKTAREALSQAGCAAGDLAGLVVNTCTGYLCPGLTSYVIEEIGCSARVRAYDLVGSGCGGALPNLQLAAALVREGQGPVLSIAVEICSATFQMADELSLLLSNALFADGAAAAVLSRHQAGWRLVASESRQLPGMREAIRYVHRQGQLFNQLSPDLPDLIARAAPELARDLLAKEKLGLEDIRHWGLHTGGEKIIDRLQAALALADEQVRPARAVLAEYGNLSSPTVLFVLKEITGGGVKPGERCLLLAFGAGLSLHALLLEME